MQDQCLIFVYGTLRKQQNNHHLLTNTTCLAEQSWTNGQLFETNYGLPFLEASLEGRVYGELYLVNQAQLEKLDRLLERYKGHGQEIHYDRVKKTVQTDTGSHQAYVYMLPKKGNKPGLALIAGGDWRVHQLLKESVDFLYFAYGSCMDHERFEQSGHAHHFQKIKGCGILDGYHLRFTRRSVNGGGRADIVEEQGTVEGKVYEVNAKSLPYLCQREGVLAGYYRPALIDLTINGMTVENVLTFVVIKKEAEIAPPLDYLNEIFRGARGYLSESYLTQLKEQLKKSFNLNI
ncbi:gamma-glutamylcyclotransferase [Peribacillus cavernae]|uniref:Gamma-glutamylcyclotransferase n=1 Tax=Peribacillus cavernae TaxID=1674310 RepID=A0A3S0VIJ9_9BACI|nr:gamma-glutamylcyclotransferase family protein [Peribacillus cavernae]MDQ0221241.1 gamma-glutamylcyclotransferase (GGCT)/AIG2-like uncharacterized protein YtfP [Peribacillus cavernae]RUQ25128.1 gamma-glutamylcyclotransferase [Peribacillus cavernae]